MNYRDFGEYVAGLDAFGDRPALVTRSFLKIERLTHQELRQRAYQSANYLRAQGVGPGDRIMVVAANSPEWVELLLGALLLGAVVTPVDASSSLAATLRAIESTDPAIVFVDQHLHLDIGDNATTRPLEGFGELIADYPSDAPADAPDPDGPALIVFTSGTTADPKGVVLSQANVLANIAGILERIAVGQDWRLLSVLPLSHMYELTSSLAILSRGACIFYIPRVTPLAIARALVDYQINTILAIPQLLSLLLERIEQVATQEGKARTLAVASRIGARLPLRARRLLFRSVHARLGGHLDLVVTGGAPIPIDVATAWEAMGVRMVQGYGLTETSPILTGNSLDDRRLDSPGRPLDNVQLRIGEDGEIQAKGPSVFRGYWHDPEATRDAFTDDGWFRTGDVGRLDDGWLYIQGRLKFAIVRASGLKVFPEDVEVTAERHPCLKESCVVGVKGPRGESVTAVVISDCADEAVANAIAQVNSQLESFQHIDDWRRWPHGDFPRTRLLKIDRRLVQRWANAAEADRATPTSGPEPADDSLIRIIRLSLGDSSATVNEPDRLADIGLDSLRRLNVVALIEEELGVTISDESVTPATTVGQLRQIVSDASPVEHEVRRPAWPYWTWVRVIGDGLREGVIRAVVRIWVRTDVVGAEELDSLDAPAIFIFNHGDDFDGPVVYQALPRRIRRRLAVATAADVMADHKVLAFVVRLCFAGFDFARAEPYMPSMEYVGQMLDRGWNVLIAPEGRISTTGELQSFKSGIGLLAVSLGVAVVPMKTVGLVGTVPLHAKWPRKRSRATVRIGRPMFFGPQMGYEDVTETLRGAMEAL